MPIEDTDPVVGRFREFGNDPAVVDAIPVGREVEVVKVKQVGFGSFQSIAGSAKGNELVIVRYKTI